MVDKPVVWLHSEIKTPPFSQDARRAAGFLIRAVQKGVLLSMPASRAMPSMGARCHELRIKDVEKHLTWRIVYRIDMDAIVIAAVFAKKTQKMPLELIELCRRRLNQYDSVSG